jgi:hypothetical protein
MGGSVAIHVAAKKVIRNLHGLVVIDVVEVSYSLLNHLYYDLQFFLLLISNAFSKTGNSNGFIDSYAEDLSKSSATFP